MGKKRKTRKEKTIISLRRRLRQQSSLATIGQQPVTNQASPSKTIEKTSKSKTNKKAAAVLRASKDSDLVLIKKDLVKSVILSGVAISTEFLLYWWRS